MGCKFNHTQAHTTEGVLPHDDRHGRLLGHLLVVLHEIPCQKVPHISGDYPVRSNKKHTCYNN